VPVLSRTVERGYLVTEDRIVSLEDVVTEARLAGVTVDLKGKIGAYTLARFPLFDAQRSLTVGSF
jgi:hypothetical protein